jgi:hypothetical protein
MKIAIVGSRNYPDLDAVRAFVRNLPPGTTIVSGGARGVDKVAELAAVRRPDLCTKIILADWDAYGKSAGYRRNVEIVNAADEVVAFWDGTSRGTAHTISIARNANKLVRIYRPGEYKERE